MEKPKPAAKDIHPGICHASRPLKTAFAARGKTGEGDGVAFTLNITKDFFLLGNFTEVVADELNGLAHLP